MNRPLRQRLLVILLTLCAGCAPHALSLLPLEHHPPFTDDLSREGLQHALQQSLDVLQRQGGDDASNATTRTAVTAALRRFKEILADKPSSQELARIIEKEFLVYQAAGRTDASGERQLLVTGYYEPLFDARLAPEPPFIHPLYAPPPDLVSQNDNASGKVRVGRLQQGRLLPYWTRTEIETGAKARGHEIAWLKDPVDVFVLQVQGSGRLRLADGSLRGVHYAASNGHPYRSIGKFLVDQGKMPKHSVSMPRIRDYLAAHPEEQDKVLHHNASFIFFRLSERTGAIGSLGRPLTAGRSVATDAAFYPQGALAYLVSRQPVVAQGKIHGWKPLSRFVVVQDSGSAIKGPGRLDLFCGDSPEAEVAAGNMKETGQLYFLFLKKKRPGPQFRPVGPAPPGDHARYQGQRRSG